MIFEDKIYKMGERESVNYSLLPNVGEIRL